MKKCYWCGKKLKNPEYSYVKEDPAYPIKVPMGKTCLERLWEMKL